MGWWHRPLRIADFSLLDHMRTDEIPRIVARKLDLAFDAEHLGVQHIEGGDRGTFYFESASAAEVPFDFLGPYLKESGKAGIRVLIYFNVHWLNPEFGALHPDWLQRRADGSAIDNVYGSGNSPCVNSPGYREWSFGAIRDLAAYPIDGVFLDGPIFIADGCWCDACRAKFRSAHGEELPTAVDWTNRTWRQFIEFRYESITDYMRDARAALKVRRPEAIIYMNGNGLWPGWPNGRDNRRLVEHQDLIGAEGGFIGYDLRKHSLWKPSMSAKLLETQARGKPTVVFIAGKNCGWDRYVLSAAETRALYAQTIACGASPWYGMFYPETDSEGARAAAEMNRIIARSAEYLERSESAAEIALVWSLKSADYYRATVPVTDFTEAGERLTRRISAGDHFNSFCGYFEILSRAHVQFDVLDEEGVEETLDRYRVLVLPNVACLSDALASRIRTWVPSGGHLLSTFETSFYDEWGERRAEPALGDLFGFTGGRVDGPARLDYFEPGEGPLAQGIEAPLVPSPTFRVLAEQVATRAVPFGRYRERHPARYQPLPPLTPYPAAIEHEFGSGRSVYYCGSFAEHYLEYHVSEHAHLLTGPLLPIAHDLLSTDAPGTLQVVVRRQSGRLMVHCINMTGEMTRPLERILPLRDVELRLPRVRSVDSVSAVIGGPVRYECAGPAGLTVTIPEIGAYELLVLERPMVESDS